MTEKKQPIRYRDAGVDIEKAETSLQRVKKAISETHNRFVLKNIGAFGGFFELPVEAYRNPVLVASTDGVGTKLKVATLMNRHHTVGQDLVNHCIDDIAVCGAEPLFFLDYFACGKLEEGMYEAIIQGFVEACKAAGLPLIGGETAEMPDLYAPGDYDLAGTIVGVVEKDQIIDGHTIREGDRLIGLASNGLHTNGYSLARKVLFQHYRPNDFVPEINNVLGEELLKIHLNYLPVIRELKQRIPPKGLAHITGGGLYKNTLRIMPEGLEPHFHFGSWPVPPIFTLIQKLGNVPEEDMRQTFNLGIGLVVVVAPEEETAVLELEKKFNLSFYRIGEVRKKS